MIQLVSTLFSQEASRISFGVDSVLVIFKASLCVASNFSFVCGPFRMVSSYLSAEIHYSALTSTEFFTTLSTFGLAAYDVVWIGFETMSAFCIMEPNFTACKVSIAIPCWIGDYMFWYACLICSLQFTIYAYLFASGTSIRSVSSRTLVYRMTGDFPLM